MDLGQKGYQLNRQEKVYSYFKVAHEFVNKTNSYFADFEISSLFHLEFNRKLGTK